MSSRFLPCPSSLRSNAREKPYDAPHLEQIALRFAPPLGRVYVWVMSEIRFSLPDDAAAALGVAPEAVGDAVRLAAAVKMYEVGRLSAGAAAALAGVPVPVLLSRLAEYKVDAFRLSGDEVARDAQSA